MSFKCYNIHCSLRGTGDDNCGFNNEVTVADCETRVSTLEELISLSTQKLEAELVSKREEIERLVDTCNDIHKDMGKIIVDRNRLQSLSDNSTKEIVELIATVFQLVDEANKLASENVGLVSTVKLDDNVIKNLRTEIDRLDAIIHSLQQRLESIKTLADY